MSIYSKHESKQLVKSYLDLWRSVHSPYDWQSNTSRTLTAIADELVSRGFDLEVRGTPVVLLNGNIVRLASRGGTIISRLTDAELKRINASLQTGTTSLKEIAQAYHLTPTALGQQLTKARKSGLIPQARRGRPKTLRGLVAEKLANAPKGQF